MKLVSHHAHSSRVKQRDTWNPGQELAESSFFWGSHALEIGLSARDKFSHVEMVLK